MLELANKDSYMTVLGGGESTGKDGYDNWRFREFRGDKEILKRKKNSDYRNKKHTISKIKNALDGTNNTWNIPEERVSKHEIK